MEGISFDQLVADPKADTRFVEVQTSKGKVTLGSLSSEYLIEWFEENEDPKRNQLSRMRLVVRSIVNPDGSRVGENVDPEARDIVIEKAARALAKRDAVDNGKLVQAAMTLNYLEAKATKAALGNAKGEPVSGASPIVSPSLSTGPTQQASSAS